MTRRFVFLLAFLFSSFVGQAEEVSSRLVQPKGSAFKLGDLKNTQELRAEFTGKAWVDGTLFGKWAEGSESVIDATPEYTLIPSHASSLTLPYFVITDPPHRNSYRIRSIEIENGEHALRVIIGSAAAQRFIERKKGTVRVTGRFQLESFAVGVECDAAWAKAKVSQVQLPSRAVRPQKTVEGC